MPGGSCGRRDAHLVELGDAHGVLGVHHPGVEPGDEVEPALLPEQPPDRCAPAATTIRGTPVSSIAYCIAYGLRRPGAPRRLGHAPGQPAGERARVDRPPVAGAALHDRDGRLGHDDRVARPEVRPGVLADDRGHVVAGHQHGGANRHSLERPPVDDDSAGRPGRAAVIVPMVPAPFVGSVVAGFAGSPLRSPSR